MIRRYAGLPHHEIRHYRQGKPFINQMSRYRIALISPVDIRSKRIPFSLTRTVIQSENTNKHVKKLFRYRFEILSDVGVGFR